MASRVTFPVFLVLIVLGIVRMAEAQVVTISDRVTGTPLDMVAVIGHDPEFFGSTNHKGQLDISALQRQQMVELSLVGYQPVILSRQQLADSGFTISLEGSRIELQQVTVTASRWGDHRNSAPGRSTGVTAREVAMQNPQTSADLLGISGEVFVQKSQAGGGSPMIRGFSTNRLLIVVDGVRMNTAIFRSGNLQNVISIDPLAVESAEVFFGPGSVNYGSDAIGGVMSFQTLRPGFSVDSSLLVTGKGLVRYSSAGEERTGHLDLGLGWKKVALLSSVSKSYFGDLRMGSNGPDEYLRTFYVERQGGKDVKVANSEPKVQRPTGYDQLNLMQKVRYRPDSHWDLEYGIHYSTTSDNPRYDRLTRVRNDGTPRSAEWEYGPQVWLMNALAVTHRQGRLLFDQATLRIAQQHFGESRRDRDFQSDMLRIREERVEAYSLNLDLQKRLGKTVVSYGAEAVHDEVFSTGQDRNIISGAEMDGPPRYPRSDWSTYGIYAAFDRRLTQSLLLQSGVRYNRFSLHSDFDTTFYDLPFSSADIDKGALTGSLGLVYFPDRAWTFRGSVSTGFRAPNVDDIGKIFDSEPGSVVVPNPGLNAEYAYNMEAGIAHLIGSRVKFDLTGYYTLLENALVRRDFQLNGNDSIVYDGELSQVQSVQNAANAYVYGLQAGLEVKLPKGFGISAHYNYQKGREELDNGTTSASRHAAPAFGITRLTYQKKKIALDLYLSYSAEVSYDDLAEEERGKAYLYADDGNGRPYSPSWYTLNFKARYQVTDQLLVSGGLENMTDQRYRTYSSGIAAAGRNLIVAVSAKF